MQEENHEQKGIPVEVRIRFVLVHEHTAVRQALAAALSKEADLECCSQVDGAKAALDAVAWLNPSLVVTELDLADGNGLDLITMLKVRFANTRTLVLSMRDEQVYAELALRAGASGFVALTEPLEKIARAIRDVVAGRVSLSQGMVNRLLRKAIEGPGAVPGGSLDQLSPRERQILDLLGHWQNAKQIAGKLNLSVKTVSYYRDRLRMKLGLNDATDLMQFATARTSGHKANPAPPCGTAI